MFQIRSFSSSVIPRRAQKSRKASAAAFAASISNSSAVPSAVNKATHAWWLGFMVGRIAASLPIVIAPSCRWASGQLLPEGLLQDLLEPCRQRAAE
jgi:hypothetical protein